MATSPQPVVIDDTIHTADTTQQEISQPDGVPAVEPAPSDMSPDPPVETAQSTMVERIAPLAAATEENSAKVEEPVTPSAATPNRRGSTRKRKQGEIRYNSTLVLI
jgi:hypothetical protein